MALTPDVLAVDDNGLTVKIVAQTIKLANNKKTTETAASGSEAFIKWKEAFDNGTPYAIVFTDNQMPGGDGLDLIKEIRAYEKLKGVKENEKVLIAMNSGDGHIEQAAREAGANEFIIKGARGGKTADGTPDKGAIKTVFEKFKAILEARELEQTLAKAKVNEEMFNKIPSPPKRQGSTLKADFLRGHKRAKSESGSNVPMSPPETPGEEIKSFDFSPKPLISIDTTDRKIAIPHQPQQPSYFEVMTPPTSAHDDKQLGGDYFQLHEPAVTSPELKGAELISQMKAVYTELRNGKTMPEDKKVVASIVEKFHATNLQRLSDGQSKLSVREYFEDKYKDRKEILTSEDTKLSKPAQPTRKRSNSH